MRIKKLSQVVVPSVIALFPLEVLAAPGKPVIAWMPAEYSSATETDITWNMWWGENGQRWSLTDNGTILCSGDLIQNGENAQKGSCKVSLNKGSHKLQVALSNTSGTTKSDIKTVLVKADSEDTGGGGDDGDSGDSDGGGDEQPVAGAPGKPVIAWLADTIEEGETTVKWDMWWGTNGSSWSLTKNGDTACDGVLTINGQQAQKGACSVDLSPGNYDLQVLLSNSAGTTKSAVKSLTVKSAGGDSGGDSGGDGGGSVGSGDTPLYTDYSSPRLRSNKPYTNSTGSVIGSYFVEWGIYGRDYHVADIPASNLTHILYGFIPICGPNKSLQDANPQGYSALLTSCQGKQDFEVTIHDSFAAIEKTYDGDKWDQDYKGNFNQLRRLTKAYPDLKVIPSIGGWTLSDPFYYLDDPSKRKIFVDSAIKLLKTYTFFAGLDIDWEFPGGGGANGDLGKESDGETYVLLMQELRAALGQLSHETGRTYQLTSAISAAPEKIAKVDYRAASQVMDYIFVMSYDYYGAWNDVKGHQAGLYDAHDAAIKGWSGKASIDALLAQGVPGNKLVLGAAMYGRGWEGVSGVNGGSPFDGQGGKAISLAKGNGHWESGVVDYYRIVDEMLGGNWHGHGANGWERHYDAIAEAPYVWHPGTGSLITYDDPRSSKAKAAFAHTHGLGGIFSWEIDADNGEILNAVHEGLGHGPAQ